MGGIKVRHVAETPPHQIRFSKAMTAVNAPGGVGAIEGMCEPEP